MSETYYKVLDEDRRPIHGGTGQWAPTAWMPVITDPEPCVRGYHLCRRQDLVVWLGPTIWVAKAGPVVVPDGDKVVSNTARLVRRVGTWDEVTARLFAADCAEHALHLFEAQRPDDSRPRDAIVAARWFALSDLGPAAGAAARDAAGDAAWAAAGDAAGAAAGARPAAGAAARPAAWAAARDAAWAAERVWQTECLFDWLENRRTVQHVREEMAQHE